MCMCGLCMCGCTCECICGGHLDGGEAVARADVVVERAGGNEWVGAEEDEQADEETEKRRSKEFMRLKGAAHRRNAAGRQRCSSTGGRRSRSGLQSLPQPMPHMPQRQFGIPSKSMQPMNSSDATGATHVYIACQHAVSSGDRF